MCVWDMERLVRVACPRVAYVLPKCRFISVSVNFEQTRYLLFLGKVMPNFCMTLKHARIFIINLFIITVQTFMMVSETMVDRWLRLAVQDMNENNRTNILCPCRRCKGGVWLDPYEDCRLMAHLLMTGFMDGYTRWII